MVSAAPNAEVSGDRAIPIVPARTAYSPRHCPLNRRSPVVSTQGFHGISFIADSIDSPL
jgi:hypothetical protein